MELPPSMLNNRSTPCGSRNFSDETEESFAKQYEESFSSLDGKNVDLSRSSTFSTTIESGFSSPVQNSPWGYGGSLVSSAHGSPSCRSPTFSSPRCRSPTLGRSNNYSRQQNWQEGDASFYSPVSSPSRSPPVSGCVSPRSGFRKLKEQHQHFHVDLKNPHDTFNIPDTIHLSPNPDLCVDAERHNRSYDPPDSRFWCVADGSATPIKRDDTKVRFVYPGFPLKPYCEVPVMYDYHVGSYIPPQVRKRYGLTPFYVRMRSRTILTSH